MGKACCLAEIPADPAQRIVALGNDDPFLIDHTDDAAAGKPVHAERILELLQTGPYGQDCAHFTEAIANRGRDANHPLAAQVGLDHVADRKLPASQGLLEIGAGRGIGPAGRRLRRSPYVGAIDRKQPDTADKVRLFAPDLRQQRVIGPNIGGIPGDCAA